ncbi:uncharacterized protein N7479_001572 [Penicillium vulpinum]|uniref:Rhodopsin domain-containing protein n=1 Tax=Penicillium vulpinum TaxID=29845 RepID=A0A1V6RUP2_9EURO|nr:uncharacterized protein N7479_001572 [Penicillium vulpinum]KAJ5971654.1 hypothetical protein N7479_001572 [Penicillium vulpinum]OQE05481.1 hypothetical protein PENVUL_c024G08357 [Penicillium vulpinum]
MASNVMVELFAEWAIGLVIIAIRIYARWKLGNGKFYWDDLCLTLAAIFWTMHTVFLYLCTDVYGSNIGLNEKTAMEVPDSQVAALRTGSIHAFVAWISYIFMVWLFKGVLMFLYNRLTMGLWQHRLTLIIGAFCVCTFVTSLFFHIFICEPVHRSWQIKPYAGDNCTIRPLNYIIIETLSITTDIAILTIPIPLVIAARIPISQKLLLCLLFSSGIFVMIAAFLRAYYSVKDISELSTALGWASREALVSVIIISAPGIKPFISSSRWFSSKGSSNRTSQTPKRSSLFSSSNRGGETYNRHPYELSSGGWGKWRRDSMGESQQHIVDRRSGEGAENWKEGIVVTTDVTLFEDTGSQNQSHS